VAQHIYSLAHITDLHFSFDIPHAFDELCAADPAAALALAQAGAFPSVEQMLKELDICSLASPNALDQAATTVELEMREALQGGRRFGCLVSGDICTWPYGPNEVASAYGYFSGSNVTLGATPAGFGASLVRNFRFVLGNHDTHTRWTDGHYWTSEFHTEHQICLDCRVSVEPPHSVGSRGLVFFICRTDFINPRGWLGPADAHTGEPFQIEYFYRVAADARKGSGPIAEAGFDRGMYDEAIKILVLHHSPLDRRLYQNIGWFDGLVTGLNRRTALLRFVQREQIHLVLFGHTHERLGVLSNGSLYLDGGTTATATLTDLEREAASRTPQTAFTMNIYDFYDNDEIAVRPYTMDATSNGFAQQPLFSYSLQNGRVAAGTNTPVRWP
jgi:hypothetical protein